MVCVIAELWSYVLSYCICLIWSSYKVPASLNFMSLLIIKRRYELLSSQTADTEGLDFLFFFSESHRMRYTVVESQMSGE